MIDPLIPIGQTSDLTLHALLARRGVRPSESGGNGGSSHDFRGDVRGEGPEVGVGDDSGGDVFVGEGLEEAEGYVGKAGVGAEGSFAAIGESHGCVGASSRELSAGEDAGVMPAETDHDGTALFFLDEGLDVGCDVFYAHDVFL